MAIRLSGLPRRQRLVGFWLLLSGISLFGGALFALWLDGLFQPQGIPRAVLWLGCFSGGGTILLVGLLLEHQLFTPLRHLQVQLARMVANPDTHDDYPPPRAGCAAWDRIWSGSGKPGTRIAIA